MNRGPVIALVALLVLLGSGASGMDSQLSQSAYGGKDPGGVADGLLDPLDVVGSFSLLEDTEVLPSAFSKGIVATRHGLVAVVVDLDDEVCRTVRLPLDDLRQVRRGVDFECDAPKPDVLRQVLGLRGLFIVEGTSATSYDPVMDAVVSCTASKGEAAVVQALDARTGEPSWGFSPQQLGLVLSELPRLNSVNEPWYCVETSLDPEARVGLAALSTYADRNAVVLFDLDTGEIEWVRTITPAALASAEAGGPDLFAPTSTRDGFVAWTGTFTDTGIIITGALGQDGTHPAVVWMSRDGDLTGWMTRDADEPDGTLLTMSSPGVSGSLGALAFEDRLLIVEPTAITPVEHVLVGRERDPADVYEFWPNPGWWDNHLLVALTGSLTNYDSTNGQDRWTLPNPAGWQPSDLLVAPPSDVYMIAARSDEAASLEDQLQDELPGDDPDAGGSAALFRVAIHDGSLLQRVPLPAMDLAEQLPGGRNNAVDWGARMVPLTDGRMVILENNGNVIVLAQAEEGLRPGLVVSEDYPQTAQPVTVQVDTPEDAESVILAWGDGSVNEVESGDNVTHSYGQTGTRTIRATVVYEDNRTATVVHAVNVGGSPPAVQPDLNFFQNAFARENQDLTFGLLGIVVALAGGLIAVGRRYTKRGRLRRELRDLEQAYEETRNDPGKCERMIADRQVRFRHLLETGKLDEPQYSVLEKRLGEMAGDLRISALDERFDFLPHGLVKALRDMLADGRISAWEREHVLHVLEADEVLTKRQKQKVRAQVDRWFKRDVGQES